ncbi:MAG: hypothetical protein K2X60_06700 [Xanthobacteraceae bacterium]|nr:hypothetical protein [Xanthobacteraceae bacterium]
MKFAKFALAILVASFVLYKILWPSATIRYRLTLFAEDNGKPTSGSGVIEVNYSRNLLPGQNSKIAIDVRGEAVELDFPNKGMLFALLKAGPADPASSAEWIVLHVFKFPDGSLTNSGGHGFEELNKLKGSADVPLSRLPLLVRFRNLNDPMTVEAVDPFNLEASFGSGTKLTRASVDIVSAGVWPFNMVGLAGEPITNTISGVLRWLPALHGKYLGGGFDSGSAPFGLHGGDFKKPA